MVSEHFDVSRPLQVFKTSWWMAHYGGKSPKRHKAFSNNKWCGAFNKGKLNVRQFSKKQKPEDRTATHYVDQQGRKRWKGTPALKSSQNLRPHNRSNCMGSFFGSFGLLAGFRSTMKDRNACLLDPFGVYHVIQN